MDFNGFAQELSRRTGRNVHMWQDRMTNLVYVEIEGSTPREVYSINLYDMTWTVVYGH